MANFGIDENIIIETVANALEDASSFASEEQFNNIANAIEEKMPGIIDILTYGMQEDWKSKAKKDSGTGWGEKYARAIKAKVTGNIGEIWVDETMIDKSSGKPSIMFTNMVEMGMKSFSIKDGLLASEKAKISADGIRYIVVPFPVRAPAKKSQGKMASHFGGREMTKEAYDLIKSGKRFTGKLKSGQEVSGLTQYSTRQHHSQFGTFMCVSEKSKGWIHPGVAASPVFPSVLKEINIRIQEVLTSFCQAVVKEFTT